MSRSGADYVKSLSDGRQVFLDGKIVDDHVSHPAFRNAVASAARMYDYMAANPETMTFEAPGGRRVSRAWEMPDTREKLIARGRASADLARVGCGFIGRSPDHVPSTLVGMVSCIDFFKAYDEKRAKALQGYYEYARDRDLYLTYTIVNPQGDRSKSAGDQGDKFHTCGIVDEDAEGITVRGAKMLGTSAILAEEVFVGVMTPLKPEEEEYAVSFAMPLAAKGIKILSRRSYEAGATSEFDYPLSTHFDENDALIYFDNVKVPWDRVFLARRPDLCVGQFHQTWAHALMNLQSQARLATKMKFLSGLARKIAETTGIIAFPPVRETLGKISAYASVVDGNFRSLTHDPVEDRGFFMPSKNQVYSSLVFTQELYPQFIAWIRELAGGGVIMLPSSAADFADEELAKLIGITQHSPTVDPLGRVKLMKLAWDALGSEFASRHVQYEMFYAGKTTVSCARSFASFDWADAGGIVDHFMNSYGLDESVRKLKAGGQS